MAAYHRVNYEVTCVLTAISSGTYTSCTVHIQLSVNIPGRSTLCASSCSNLVVRGHIDELATEPFPLLHCEHGTGYWRNWNCCDQRTRFIVIWKHFCFIPSTGTRIRTDSVMHPRSSNRGVQYKCLSYSYRLSYNTAKNICIHITCTAHSSLLCHLAFAFDAN